MYEAIRQYAKPFHSSKDFEPLIEAAGSSKYVLLGEASHGTSEFYSIRADLTKRLLKEKHFSFIAVEGDWPACERVNRYIKGYDQTTKDLKELLQVFDRWPTWMWANQEITGLIEWMKDFNKDKPDAEKVGFYGLDVYSLWESMEAIIQYLEINNLPVADDAKKAFSCFEPYKRNHESYAISAGFFSENCTEEVLNLLTSIRQHKWDFEDDYESSLNMEVNALVTANAEKYYRTMVTNDEESWNIRDRHMVEALNTVIKFYGDGAKAIIWEHNTHVGDARATDMKDEGMVNVGQLLREQNDLKEVYIVGFGTFTGTVIASTEWGIDLKVTSVPPAQYGSWEYLLHNSGAFNKYLLFTDQNRIQFNKTVGHRAIGVVYQPEYEHFGNYVPSVIGQRYDAFVFVDHTEALHPLVLEPVNI